jgi:hypothetical protein
MGRVNIRCVTSSNHGRAGSLWGSGRSTSPRSISSRRGSQRRVWRGGERRLARQALAPGRTHATRPPASHRRCPPALGCHRSTVVHPRGAALRLVHDSVSGEVDLRVTRLRLPDPGGQPAPLRLGWRRRTPRFGLQESQRSVWDDRRYLRWCRRCDWTRADARHRNRSGIPPADPRPRRATRDPRSVSHPSVLSSSNLAETCGPRQK